MAMIERLPQYSTRTSGTHLQGYVRVPYARLVEVFGEPTWPEGDGDKTDAEWDLLIDGLVCTVYNYKDGHNYNDGAGMETAAITDWHVGGHTRAAAIYVGAALGVEAER